MQQKELTYKSIEQEILHRIRSGVYRPGQQLPPERQLEKEFSASRITIAKGLSNLTSSGYITRTRGRGSFVCDHLPSDTGSRMKPANSKGIIKYISPPGSSDNPVTVSNGILEAMHGVLTPAGYHVGIDFYSTVERQLEILNSFTDPINEGFVIWPSLDPKVITVLHKMQKAGFPFVLVDVYFPEVKCDYIISDNGIGAETMINYLVNCGHRNISYFTATPDRVSLSERMSGVISALSKHGLSMTPNTVNVIPCGDKVDSSYRSSQNTDYLKKRLEELLSSPIPPTAIFCSNDWIAMTIHSLLEKMGVKVPEQISLCGYDNIDASQYFRVPLTTVSQNFFEMGQMAARVLVSRCKNNDSPGSMKLQQRIEPELIIRDSVRKLI